MSARLSGLVISALMLAGPAIAQGISVLKIETPVTTPASIERLPIEGLSKVTDQSGAVYFISDNRRFVFRGEMTDLWSGSDISLVPVSQQIDLERNGISVERIAIEIGNGNERITAFVAPECIACKTVVETLLSPAGQRRYKANVVLLDVSEAGANANRVVWCAADKVEAIRAVYLDDRIPGTAARPGEDCDQLGLLVAKQAAKLFGIGQLPLMVDGEGIGTTGIPNWFINEKETR